MEPCEERGYSKLMMDKPSLKLALDIVGLQRTQIRAGTRLITGHCTLRKHPHTMGTFKNDALCRLPNELGEATSRNNFNPLNAELNPICYLLALLGAHHFLHVSRIRVKSLTLRLLMSFIYKLN